MTRTLKVSAIFLLAMLVLAPAASAWPPHVVVVGGGFGWWGPGYYAYAPVPNAGKIKIVTKMKDASVYIDNGYAGTVAKLKTFPLRAGKHTIELRTHDGHSFYQERIDVIAGKTMELHPD
jgi:hypothetical protein